MRGRVTGGGRPGTRISGFTLPSLRTSQLPGTPGQSIQQGDTPVPPFRDARSRDKKEATSDSMGQHCKETEARRIQGRHFTSSTRKTPKTPPVRWVLWHAVVLRHRTRAAQISVPAAHRTRRLADRHAHVSTGTQLLPSSSALHHTAVSAGFDPTGA
eukprot:691685-Rhodomonas_salina.1